MAMAILASTNLMRISEAITMQQKERGANSPKAPEFLFSTWWGVNFFFLFLLCILKMLRISWGSQICMQNMKLFPTLDLPHAAPQTWLLGPYPQGVKPFFNNPTHVCSK